MQKIAKVCKGSTSPNKMITAVKTVVWEMITAPEMPASSCK